MRLTARILLVHSIVEWIDGACLVVWKPSNGRLVTRRWELKPLVHELQENGVTVTLLEVHNSIGPLIDLFMK